ncbi:MAG: peptidoglycan DD-metalloendopeptidase family protein [Rhodobacteraceae bacterium]|nr:peptidoglycan DD-metalloendopeptidase family protein [Paracoccaceae bacterium]
MILPPALSPWSIRAILTASTLLATPVAAQPETLNAPVDTPAAPQELIATPQAARAAAEAAERRAAQARREAAALESEKSKMAEALAMLGPKIVNREYALSEAIARLDVLHMELEAAQTRLAATRKKLHALLIGVQRAAREPTPSLVVRPDRPVAAARSALLLRRLGVELQHTAAAARADLDRIAAAEQEVSVIEAKARADYAALRAAEADVRALLAQKRDAQAQAQNRAEEAAAAAKRFAREARTLSELALALADPSAPRASPDADAQPPMATYTPPKDADAAQRPAAPPRLAPPSGPGVSEQPASPTPITPPGAIAIAPNLPSALPPLMRPAPKAPPSIPFHQAKGELIRPVAGLALEGDREDKGLAFSTAPYARVISPWGGEIVFADHFPGYGRVVIIEPQPDFLVLLTGLAEVDRDVGEQVLAGEPIGRMGGPPQTSPEFLYEVSSNTRDQREQLYFEIRRKGAPIDPEPWLRPETRKATGL